MAWTSESKYDPGGGLETSCSRLTARRVSSGENRLVESCVGENTERVEEVLVVS